MSKYVILDVINHEQRVPLELNDEEKARATAQAFAEAANRIFSVWSLEGEDLGENIGIFLPDWQRSDFLDCVSDETALFFAAVFNNADERATVADYITDGFVSRMPNMYREVQK